MQAALRLYDETPGAARRPAGTLRLVSERTTLRELLRRRIEEEAARIEANGEGDVEILVQPSWYDRVKSQLGGKGGDARRIDIEAQSRTAYRAFERNGFIALFDDRQVSDLDEPLILTGDNTLTFVRLVPLVGG